MTTRRQFISMLSSATVGWPVAARGQQAKRVRRIGVLLSFQKNDPQGEAAVTLIKKILHDAGWIDGQNIQMIVRLSRAGNDDVPVVEKAKELVRLSPDVILASPTSALLPLLRETTNIPIVFAVVSDPLSQGIVPSLARPGGHITGFSNPPFSLVGKSLQMLKDIAPSVSSVALMISATHGSAPGYLRVFGGLARSLGLTSAAYSIHSRSEIELAFEILCERAEWCSLCAS